MNNATHDRLQGDGEDPITRLTDFVRDLRQGGESACDCAIREIRQLQARHEKYEKALRLGAVTMRKVRKTFEAHEATMRDAIKAMKALKVMCRVTGLSEGMEAAQDILSRLEACLKETP